ncbi:hypothetical protein BC826DRAFT_182613 [Russula brevipes]|nr:hypothetical protein BC826DRAFT_182613 [Russula brevipes]
MCRARPKAVKPRHRGLVSVSSQTTTPSSHPTHFPGDMAGPLANDMITSRCCHMCRGIQADRRSRHHHFDCLCYFFPLLCLKSFAPLDRFKEDPRHRRPPMSVPRSRSTTEHPVVSVRPTPVHFSPPSTRPPASLSALATRTPQPIDGAPTCDGSSGCRHLMGHWREPLSILLLQHSTTTE